MPPPEPDVAALAERIDSLTGTSAATPAPASFDRLLVAVDGSGPSEHAIDWAIHLAKPGVEVRVVTVVPGQVPAVEHRAMGDVALQPVLDEDVAYAREVLDDAVERFRAAGVPVEAELLKGAPVWEITRTARESDTDLVLLGSTGRTSGGGSGFLGRVSEGVRDYARTNVLIARRGPPPRHVLLPVDGSPASRRAAATGLGLARETGSRVTMLHVFELPLFSMERGEETMRGMVERAGVPWEADDLVEPRVDFGRPNESIRREVERTGADLVVLGRRGSGGFRELLVGSTADRVSHRVDASVLLVHAERASAGEEEEEEGEAGGWLSRAAESIAR